MPKTCFTMGQVCLEGQKQLTTTGLQSIRRTCRRSEVRLSLLYPNQERIPPVRSIVTVKDGALQSHTPRVEFPISHAPGDLG